VTDAKVFYRLETWRADADDPTTTSYLRQIASFQRYAAMSAYRIAGGSEERANATLMGSSSGASIAAGKVRQDGVSPIVLDQC
jgi:exocyst complex component 2